MLICDSDDGKAGVSPQQPAVGLAFTFPGGEDPNLAGRGDGWVPNGDAAGRRFGGNHGAIDIGAGARPKSS